MKSIDELRLAFVAGKIDVTSHALHRIVVRNIRNKK
jgi:hypothetical protein